LCYAAFPCVFLPNTEV